LRRLGFAGIAFHWHRPSFQGALEIIPLEHDAIERYALAGDSRRPRAGAKRLLARALLAAGLLQGLVSCVSVVACRSACGEEAV
jgi:hypothetical protein